MTTPAAQPRRQFITVKRVIVVLALLVIAALVLTFLPSIQQSMAQVPTPQSTVSTTSTPNPSASPEDDEWEATIESCNNLSEQRAQLESPSAYVAFGERNADKFEECRQLQLAECRPVASMGYMEAMGFRFAAGEYVIGETNIDQVAATSVEVGPSAFRDRSGKIPTTRAQLQEAFESTFEGNVAMMDRLRQAYPSLPDRVLFDPSLWEIVQVNVATEMSGNTGYSFLAGQVINYREAFQAQPGETFWLPIDPATCGVRPMEVQPANADPDDPPAAGVIRAACLNGGTGLSPKDPSKDPWQQGNAPTYGGPNATPGPGERLDLDQPTSNPRVDPAPPAPSDPPADSTPDPAPPGVPQPSAPPSDDPVDPDEGNGCAPGLAC